MLFWYFDCGWMNPQPEENGARSLEANQHTPPYRFGVWILYKLLPGIRAQRRMPG
jgi:hypothetical protein